MRKCSVRVKNHGPATFIGTVEGFDFFECPKHGDEVPLLVLIGGDYFETDFYDLPYPEEVREMTNEN